MFKARIFKHSLLTPGRISRCIGMVVAPCALMLLMAGCHTSPAEVGLTVKDSMQQTFDKDPDFSKMHYKVDNVLAVKKTETAYDGTASITYKGTSHQVPVHITVNKDDVNWKTDPGTLDFEPPAPATSETVPDTAPAQQ